MSDADDGMNEVIDGQLRLAVAVAAQVGQILAQQRQERLERMRDAQQDQARELSRRFEAERLTAHAELAAVHEPAWWDQANADQIGRAYEVARAWAPHDPNADRTEALMRAEIQRRYGVDVLAAGADPAAVRETVRAKLDRPTGTETAQTAEAAQLMAAADAEERAAQRERDGGHLLDRDAEAEHKKADEAEAAVQSTDDPEEREKAQQEAETSHDRGQQDAGDAEVRYDSAERREASAAELERKGVDRELVDTKTRADVSQGKPATDAVKDPTKSRPKARKTPKKPVKSQTQRLGR